MGCSSSSNASNPGTTTVWACQYCGTNYRTYQQAEACEKRCARNNQATPLFQPGQQFGGQPAYAAQQLAYAAQQGGKPLHIQCGGCRAVFGAPPGHAQVRCPKCNTVNAVPVQSTQASIPQNLYNQQIGSHPAAQYGGAAPSPTGRKRALLVGINYFGTRAELRGCINDVHRVRGLITSMYGFPGGPNDMMVLTDDSHDPYSRPTRANILRGLHWLAEGAQPGDALFFHFSGHGAQQEDPNYSEEDGYDETICPCDFESAGMIVDDEIFDAAVAPLPSGAKLTALLDCCHSGTGLDLPFTLQYGSWMEDDNPCHSAGDVVLISGCQDEQCSSDGGGAYNRPMGAMTTALCNTLERNPILTHSQLLDELRSELRRGGFEQIPSLTSSQRFDPQSRLFSPADGMIANENPQLGRMFRKKKHPKRQALLSGGLGEMLMAGAVGFMIGDMMGGGDLVAGLAMGGGDMLAGGADMLGGGADMMAGGAGMMGGFFGGGGDGGFFDGGDDFGDDF